MRILAPDWHASMIGPRCSSIDRELEERLPAAIVAVARRIGPLRGVLLYLLARNADRVGVIKNAPGTITYLFCEAWLARGGDRAVVLTFLVRPLPRRRLRRTLYRAWFAAIERPAVRRAMRTGHVLTDWERERYAELYGVPRERFRLLPWARSETAGPLPEFIADPGRGVLSSGRASCDWETLFAAARGREWPLTVICAQRDLARVRALNSDRRARVLCDVPPEHHDRILASSAVFALCLSTDGPGAGHVRLMAAVERGVPVVASDVPALVGYVEDGETAALVPPGDPARLGQRIDELLSRPEERMALRERALERARHWTYGDFFDAIGSLLGEP
jgi:hypothetical protein